MKLLVADREGALVSDMASQWMDHWSIEIRPKEVGAHAQIVERHHDALQRLLLRTEEQLTAEGLVIPMSALVAECSLMKNLLISVGGFSPYTAPHG